MPAQGDTQTATKLQPDVPPVGVEPSSSFYRRRLVFFGVAESKTEPVLLQLFLRHGEVSDMFVVRSALGASSGCGYVTFATPEQAAAALKALAGSTECAEPGTPLGVLLVEEASSSTSKELPAATDDDSDDVAAAAAADTSAGTNTSSVTGSTTTAASDATSTQAQAEPKSGTSVFFTKVPPTVTSQQLIQLFSACGEVAHLELFIPWPGAKISRGCGLVEFTDARAAAAAVHSLHQHFIWPRSHSALIVEWTDNSRQRGSSGQGVKVRGFSRGAEQQQLSYQQPSHAQFSNHLAATQGLHWTPAHHHHQQQQQQLLQAGMTTIRPLHQQQQQGNSSHSRPVPQLPPGWQVLGTTSQLPAGAQVVYPSEMLHASKSRSTEHQLSMRTCTTPGEAASLAAAGSRPGQQADLPATLVPQYGSDASSSSLWHSCPAIYSDTSVDPGSLTPMGSGHEHILPWFKQAVPASDNTFTSSTNTNTVKSGILQAQPTQPQPQPQQLIQQQQQQQLLSLSASSNIIELCASHDNPLAACSAPGLAHARMPQGQQQQQQGQQQLAGSSVCTASGAIAGSSNDVVWQQLLQQNVLLLQSLTPPPEDQPLTQSLLLPPSSFAAAQQQQEEGLAGTVGDGLMTPASGVMIGSMHPLLPPLSQTPGLSTSSMLPLSQAPRLSTSSMHPHLPPLPQPPGLSTSSMHKLLPLSQPPGLSTSSALLQPHQELPQAQAQRWFVPQGQAQQRQELQVESSAILAIPLAHCQLTAMAGVLAEVPKLTGAQAWISSAASGGVQLCLGGTYGQLQAGRTAVAMLLSTSGVNEPLAAAVLHAAPY